jgi:hypothetical protein
MTAQVKWEDDTKKVLIFTFEGYWLVPEFYDVFKQSNTLLDTVDYKVHMIIDIRESKSLPTGFFNAVRTVSKAEHPNAGKVAMVGMNTFTRAFILAVRQVLRKRSEDQWMQIVADYDEAHRLFAESDKPTEESPVIRPETETDEFKPLK